MYSNEQIQLEEGRWVPAGMQLLLEQPVGLSVHPCQGLLYSVHSGTSGRPGLRQAAPVFYKSYVSLVSPNEEQYGIALSERPGTENGKKSSSGIFPYLELNGSVVHLEESNVVLVSELVEVFVRHHFPTRPPHQRQEQKTISNDYSW